MKLLIRLHIITPFSSPEDEEESYFIPCVLNHVPETYEEDLDTDILPLSVRFKCEHCPKGLFGVLVIYLLTHKPDKDPDSCISLTLLQDKIFRDQSVF